LVASKTTVRREIGEVTWPDEALKDAHSDEEEEPPKAATKEKADDSEPGGGGMPEWKDIKSVCFRWLVKQRK
jgi:hypothetical protein